jgi:hypothetical protein
MAKRDGGSDPLIGLSVYLQFGTLQRVSTRTKAYLAGDQPLVVG